MDKAATIAKIAQEPEDRLLLARIWDKYEQTQRKNIPAATVFLSPRERQLAQSLLNAAGAGPDICLTAAMRRRSAKSCCSSPTGRRRRRGS